MNMQTYKIFWKPLQVAEILLVFQESCDLTKRYKKLLETIMTYLCFNHIVVDIRKSNV